MRANNTSIPQTDGAHSSNSQTPSRFAASQVSQNLLAATILFRLLRPVLVSAPARKQPHPQTTSVQPPPLLTVPGALEL